MAVFLTGATGFLGTETAAELIRTTKEKIYVLVRAADNEEAAHRLRAIWYEVKELYREIGERIIPLTGDFTQADLGLEPAVLRQLRGEISIIYHIGAETGIQKSQKDLMTINRNGTGYMIRFARKTDRERSLRRFVYVSTAYTAGMRTGRIMEDDPACDTGICRTEVE